MAVTVWGQLFVQASAPAEDPVQVGSVWSDTATGALKVCTSISPYTFSTISGGSGAPTDADYLVKTAHGDLSAERVVTDGTSITADWSVAGQVVLKRAALTGDVTAAADDNATTIANDAVTFAKMQNIATDSLMGRDTAASGDPENILLNATLEMDGSGNLRRAALTGDVTATAGSNATTIANDAVTNAKAANMAEATIKGRAAAAGTGDPTDLTANQVSTILDAATDPFLRTSAAGGDGTPTEQTTTSTGTQNNFSLSAGFTHLRCNNASALVLTGFTVGGNAPTAGDRVLIDNIGSSTVRIADQDTNSTDVNRAIWPSARGQIVGAKGRMLLVYDGTTQRWRGSLVDPGEFITVAYNSGDFTGNGSMTWTVDSGDLKLFAYQQRGRSVSVVCAVESSSIGGTPDQSLLVTFPGGFTPSDAGATTLFGLTYIIDNGTARAGRIAATTTKFEIGNVDGSNWAASTNNTRVYVNQAFRVN